MRFQKFMRALFAVYCFHGISLKKLQSVISGLVTRIS